MFYHIRAWRPSWSRGLDRLNKDFNPLSHACPTRNLALIGQAVLEQKIFENGGLRRTDNGRTHKGLLYYRPGEPNGSSELMDL